MSGTATEAGITYDMVRGALSSYSWTGSKGISTVLGFNIQAVRAGMKTPTYLWLPNDNGTVSANPWGLKTYVGEQGFDLVVANNSYGTALTSDGAPFPWGSTYSVNLGTGLTNFLVPRGQFLNSTLGRAVLLGAALPYATGANPPLIVSGSGNEGSLLTGFGGANLMTDLGCYWQNLAIVPPGSGGICSAETGTAGSSSANVRVAAAGYSSSNAGGVPGNPTIETGTEAGAALQAVVTLNVSSQNQLDLLLAALLDNCTGGVNGTFQNVALYVPSLGLPNAVLAALANATTTSYGLYGVPQDTSSSSTSSGSVWSLLWNTFSGLVDTVVAAVQTVVSVVYNAVVATIHFFENLPQALAKWGETAIARTVSALVTAGQALDTALNNLIALVVAGVEAVLESVIGPLVRLNNQYYSGIQADYVAGYKTVASGGALTPSEAAAFWTSASGSMFELVTGIGIVISIAVGIVSDLSLGAGFVVGIVVQLLLSSSGINHGSSIANGVLSPPTSGAPFVKAAWGLANLTGNSLLSSGVTFWRSLIQFFGILAGAAALGVLISLAFLAAITSSFYIVGFAAVASLIFTVLSLLAYGYWYQNGETQTGIWYYSWIVGALGASVGFIGLLKSPTPATKVISAIGVGAGTISVLLDLTA